jgi:hypothetical protein
MVMSSFGYWSLFDYVVWNVTVFLAIGFTQFWNRRRKRLRTEAVAAGRAGSRESLNP